MGCLCQYPGRSQPIIEWDSVGASAHKCGFSRDGAYFLRRTTTFSTIPGEACSCENEFNPEESGTSFPISEERLTSRTESFSLPDCVYSSHDTTGNVLVGYGCSFGPGEEGPCCQPSGGPACPTTESVEEYTDEDTIEAVEGRAQDALAEESYPDSWNGSGPLRARDDYSVSLVKGKWRLWHDPSASCYLKVWLRKVFTPQEEGAEPTITDLDPYTWSGSGSPCLPDPSKGVGQEENIVRSTPKEIDPPEQPGTISIEVAKYSFLPGYEPTNLMDSGWPPEADA